MAAVLSRRTFLTFAGALGATGLLPAAAAAGPRKTRNAGLGRAPLGTSPLGG